MCVNNKHIENAEVCTQKEMIKKCPIAHQICQQTNSSTCNFEGRT